MNDLSHWHFAEQFSPYEARALILGFEPRDSQDQQGRIGVVTDRMQLDYEEALAAIWSELNEPPFGDDYQPRVEKPNLPSIKLASLIDDYVSRNWETPLIDWLADRRLPKFDNQEFSRGAIVSWLAEIGMKSEYSFSRDEQETPSVRRERWPWGDHHTEALGHLEAAATRFWSGFDASDMSTANTNAQVSEWLQTERRVSKTMADSIASMLRLDGLPTGPRK